MATRDEYIAFAEQQARSAGIDPAIFVRQIGVESNWDPSALSPAGAIGIAQIVPRWHPGVDPWDPWASLTYAAQLMRSHLDRFGGRYDLALAAYNAGAGTVEQYGGVPPFEETQRYVRLILGDGAVTEPVSGNPPPAGGSSISDGGSLGDVVQRVRLNPWPAFFLAATVLLVFRPFGGR